MPPWIVVVGGLALAAGFAIAAILQVSNALPNEILTALTPVEEYMQSTDGRIGRAPSSPALLFN